ncbi:MAG: ImmA/IrrE family metallo-endopeptidase [Candidatus Bathyarchaeia archaeon]|jgi:hypothetical protein
MTTERQFNSPIDIETVANSFWLEVIYEHMLSNGCLQEISPNKYVIKVNKNDIRVRQRFTIAHEIAHLIITKEGLHKTKSLLKEMLPIEERFIHYSTDEERICDFISASLLIPLYTMKRTSEWTKISIDMIEELSKQWVVSKDVILRRILALAPYEGGYIWGKTGSNSLDAKELDLQSCWGVFPKYKKFRVPAEIHIKTSHNLESFEKEQFDRVIFDLEGLKGLRLICAKSYGVGDEKRMLIIVYPREFKESLH